MMKKKLSWLCIVVVVVLCISFFVWRNRIIRVVDIIDFDTITKVEIWLNDDCVTLTKNGDIKEFTDILDSMKLKKKLRPKSDGFVLPFLISSNIKKIWSLFKGFQVFFVRLVYI